MRLLLFIFLAGCPSSKDEIIVHGYADHRVTITIDNMPMDAGIDAVGTKRPIDADPKVLEKP